MYPTTIVLWALGSVNKMANILETPVYIDMTTRIRLRKTSFYRHSSMTTRNEMAKIAVNKIKNTLMIRTR